MYSLCRLLMLDSPWAEAVQRVPEGAEPTFPARFGDRVRSEMNRILDDYVPLRSRGDRLAFLRKLVRGAPGPGQVSSCQSPLPDIAFNFSNSQKSIDLAVGCYNE